jgi:hypothetical protein
VTRAPSPASIVPRLLLAAALSPAAALAQWPNPRPDQPQQPQQPQQGQRLGDQEKNPPVWPPQPRPTPAEGFPGLRSIDPNFQGFPLFAPNVPGFGGYPTFPGEIPGARSDRVLPVLPVHRPRAPDQWPSWLLGSMPREERALPDRAILRQIAERVWFRAADERAYVPLAFYDKLRVFYQGAAVRVNTDGKYEVLLHDSATVRNEGPSHLEVRTLSDDLAEIDVQVVEQLWVVARTRLVRLLLPDQSQLSVKGAQVYLLREHDRLHVRNIGPGKVALETAYGRLELAPANTIALMLVPPARSPIPQALTVGGTATAEAQGRRLRVSGGAEGGTVEWGGVRVRVGAGREVVLDALAGAAFPEFRDVQPRGSSSRNGGSASRGQDRQD